MKIQTYRDFKVWQRSMDLVVACYQVTKKFPKTEIYSLTSQLQRSAVSVPSNIAEGRGKRGTKEFLRHLAIAYGSLTELETHIQIAQRLLYVDQNESSQLLEQTAQVGRMINGLRLSLRNKLPKRTLPPRV